jgi:hypothetical protein
MVEVLYHHVNKQKLFVFKNHNFLIWNPIKVILYKL